MNEEIIAVILGLVAIIVISLLFWPHQIFGFVMTQNLTEESRILELCIHLDAYIPNCDMIYGGKDYGDKLQ